MSNKKIFNILSECSEVIGNLKNKDQKLNGEHIIYKPFFNSLTIKDSETYLLESLNGSIVNYKDPSFRSHMLNGRIEMRMGHSKKGGSVERKRFFIPRNLEENMSKQQIFEACNDLFWDCAYNLEDRYQRTLGEKNNREKYLYFSKENPSRFIQKELNFEIDLNPLENDFKKASKNLKRSWIKDIGILFESSKEKRYYVNSEGSKIFTNSIRKRLMLEIYVIDDKNLVIPYGFQWFGNELSETPGYGKLIFEGEKIISKLEKILKSPIQKNGVFPTILDSQNAGVLFHEGLGHALEGHRMQEDEFGNSTNLFKGKLGELIAPEFLDLYDNPTIKDFKGFPLNGYFSYDEEGVKSQNLKLIEKGILKNYLHSRQSAGYFKIKSNGHCRSEELNDPCPRMGNIIVKSSNETTFEKLKEALIIECEKQGKPYGLFLSGSASGEVVPEESFYNTTPSNLFRIYTNGKMERVRSAYVVGTPHQTMANIIQTSNHYQVFNGYCGAESGFIPQTEIAPDILIKMLEVNKIPDDCYMKVYESVFDKKSKK